MTCDATAGSSETTGSAQHRSSRPAFPKNLFSHAPPPPPPPRTLPDPQTGTHPPRKQEGSRVTRTVGRSSLATDHRSWPPPPPPPRSRVRERRHEEASMEGNVVQDVKGAVGEKEEEKEGTQEGARREIRRLEVGARFGLASALSLLLLQVCANVLCVLCVRACVRACVRSRTICITCGLIQRVRAWLLVLFIMFLRHRLSRRKWPYCAVASQVCRQACRRHCAPSLLHLCTRMATLESLPFPHPLSQPCTSQHQNGYSFAPILSSLSPSSPFRLPPSSPFRLHVYLFLLYSPPRPSLPNPLKPRS